MSRLRAPSMVELTAILRDMPDGPERARVEEWYWAKAVDHYGVRRARWYREEYEWLRAQRRREEILADLHEIAGTARRPAA